MTVNYRTRGYIPFRPLGSQPPSFMVELDGQMQRLTVTWNVSAQRFYFNLYDHMGIWVVTAPLIETGPGLLIDKMVYDPQLRSVVVTLLEPYWRPLGQIVDWALEGVDPENLNGQHRCITISDTEFIFYVLNNPIVGLNPGQMALHGTAHRYVDLVKGFVQDSVLLFRNGSFETIP